jgi:hypothetical protein
VMSALRCKLVRVVPTYKSMYAEILKGNLKFSRKGLGIRKEQEIRLEKLESSK